MINSAAWPKSECHAAAIARRAEVMPRWAGMLPPPNAGVADEDAGAVLVHLRVEAFFEVDEGAARGEFEPATGEMIGGRFDAGEILDCGHCRILVEAGRWP